MTKQGWLRNSVLWIGLLLILGYWLALHPPGWGRLGYGEDLGGIELTRQLMADSLREHGRPDFYTHRMMAPEGTSDTFCSWSLERDWVGAYFWMWNHDFPWLWVYFGISLLVSYFGAGFILGKMELSSPAAWGLATLAVLFHVPRHFKAHYHFEHLIEHWAYLGIFLDAWIWRIFWRDRRWSWNLEAWRGFIMIGTFGIGGYYWGAMLLEWIVFRISVGITIWRRARHGRKTPIDLDPRKLALPIALSVAMIAVELQWFLPLARSAARLGVVPQGPGWTAPMQLVFRPLWIEAVLGLVGVISPAGARLIANGLTQLRLYPLEATETLVSIGWVFWIPLLLGVWRVRKRYGGPGVGALAPFLAFMAIMIIYAGTGWPFSIHGFIMRTIPFMNFFRVVSRMGLFMPATAAATIALSWPELSAWAAAKWRSRDPAARALFALFLLSALGEFAILRTPVTTMPPMNEKMLSMLSRIKALPGNTVLNLPFCVAGGNGMCTELECPNYPRSVATSILTGWHDKKVYGFYEARLVPSQCMPYDQMPYLSWFDAWRRQRCLQGREWKDFCEYLDQRAELSAVMVFPGIWTALEQPQCRREFDEHLGKPIDEGEIFTSGGRGGIGLDPTSVLWYGTKCLDRE